MFTRKVLPRTFTRVNGRRNACVGAVLLIAAVVLGASASAHPGRHDKHGKFDGHKELAKGPEYEVQIEADGYEIRRYESYVLAETPVGGEGKEGWRKSFGALADYIFGNNSRPLPTTAPPGARATSERIAMTAPVLRQEVVDDQEQAHVTLAFIMPAGYSRDTLPRPNNPDVTLREIPAHTAAALHFSGEGKAEEMESKAEELQQALYRDGLEPIGAPVHARYDPPWTPHEKRRNEVLIEIAPPDSR